jgi:ABC-type sugar transport systems, permease components
MSLDNKDKEIIHKNTGMNPVIKRKFSLTRKNKMYVFTTLSVLPAFLLYTVFILYPLIQGLLLSFYDWSGLSADKVFVGLINYKALLEEKDFFSAFYNDMFLAVSRIVLVIIIAFFFAEVLCRMKLREKEFYKLIFFFPNVLSIVVISILWVFIYNPNFGILNELLNSIGLGFLAKPWLSDFGTVLPALVAPSVWATIGFYLIIFTAAIQGIPHSLYESSMLDGAKYFQQFFKITVPLAWEHVKISILLLVVGCFGSNFAIVNVMTGGGPADESNVLQLMLYKEAFENHNYGYAATIGAALTGIALIYTLIVNTLLKRDTVEY